MRAIFSWRGLYAFVIAGSLTLLVGCQTASKSAVQDLSLSKTMSTAKRDMQKGDYISAGELYQSLELRYPYTEEAHYAPLLAAYAYYLDADYTNAILSAQRFIDLNPGEKGTLWSKYVIAQSYYEQMPPIYLDQEPVEKAYQGFLEIYRRHPGTQYAVYASLKLPILQERLAAHEMRAGRYYLFHDAPTAAAIHFLDVINKYPRSMQTPEALARLVETYLKLGIVIEAQKTAAILGHNYPHSPWYMYIYMLFKRLKISPLKAPYFKPGIHIPKAYIERFR